MTLLELAQKLRPYIEKAAASLNDEDALEAINLFPNWDPESHSYLVDDRVNYEGILYRCLQPHTSQEGWDPLSAASLWAKVLIPDVNVVPEWEQPDSTNPYMKGDKVRHNGKVWISTMDYNVFEPGVAGWEAVG